MYIDGEPAGTADAGALSAEEIKAHFAAPEGAPKQDTGLVLAFSFDDEKAADESGNGNDGILQNAHPVKGKFAGAMRTRGVRRRGMSQLPLQVKHDWSQELPLHARAMVLAGDTLLIAGPPDLVDEEESQKRLLAPEIVRALAEQSESFAGKRGGMLWAVSPGDGGKLAEWELKSPPIFDGLIATKGRLYMTTMGGSVLCYAGT